MAATDQEIRKKQLSKRLGRLFLQQPLRSARDASRVRGAVNERPCKEGRTARRTPVDGTSPKTSSAGLALPLLAKKERLTPAASRLASSLRRAPGRLPRWFDDMPGAYNDSRIDKIHPHIRLILCASRDAPHISPASVILFANVLGNGCPFHCQHSTPHMPPWWRHH